MLLREGIVGCRSIAEVIEMDQVCLNVLDGIADRFLEIFDETRVIADRQWRYF